MESKKDQKPYPYEAEDFTMKELEKIKSTASLRGFNVFQDYNHIIYSLAVQLIEERQNAEDS